MNSMVMEGGGKLSSVFYLAFLYLSTGRDDGNIIDSASAERRTGAGHRR